MDAAAKVLVLFYADKYLEQLRWNAQTTLLCVPVLTLSALVSWVYLRPSCGFCGALMQERVVSKAKYALSKCWHCDAAFVARDSIWICPFERKIRFHQKRYLLDEPFTTAWKEIVRDVKEKLSFERMVRSLRHHKRTLLDDFCALISLKKSTSLNGSIWFTRHPSSTLGADVPTCLLSWNL